MDEIIEQDIKYSQRKLDNHYDYSIPLNDFFRCALSVDCAVFGYTKSSVKVLLIERGAEPFKRMLALPGDLMYPYENLEEAAKRVLSNLTGIDKLYMQQVKTFGEVNRHPVGRVVTVGYCAFVNRENCNPVASSWASELTWMDLNEVPQLAFDHNKILETAISNLRKSIRTEPIAFELLPEKFTLMDVQSMYESVLGAKFDKANFRKKVIGTELLTPLKENEVNVAHRPAKLYQFNRKKYEKRKKEGASFEI